MITEIQFGAIIKTTPAGYRATHSEKYTAAGELKDIINLKTIPAIGIAGEIFVKYNNYGNKNIINWLISQGIEPRVPPLSDFFTDAFPNYKARVSCPSLNLLFIDFDSGMSDANIFNRLHFMTDNAINEYR